MLSAKFIFKLTVLFLSLSFVNSQACRVNIPTCTAQLQNQHFPSGVDCDSYCTCFNNSYVRQWCPTGFWFQRRGQTCAAISQVHDCEFAPVTTTTVTTTTTTTTTPTTTTSTTTAFPLTCDPTGAYKMVNPSSCTRYFWCFDGSRRDSSCSPGLHFSRSSLLCVRPENSDCPLDNDIESCPSENDPDNMVFLADQENCQNYFLCLDGVPEERKCDDGLHWDPKANWCIIEENSACAPSYPLPELREIDCPETTGDELVFVPHPEDCQFYFMCFRNKSFLTRCARDHLFDHILLQCYFREFAVCFNASEAA